MNKLTPRKFLSIMKNHHRLSSALFFVLGTVIFYACQKNETTETLTPSVDSLSQSRLAAFANSPADNPTSTAKVALGKMLFYDPILSGKKDVACATCHHPSTGYSDGLDLSIGVNATGFGTTRHFLSPNTIAFVKRNAQTILNSGFNGMNASGVYNPSTAPMFWDNRTQSLENQSLGPIVTLEEMRGTTYSEAVALDSVVARLRNITEYRTLFQAAFGNVTQAITAINLGKAIASFERTLITNNSPYDRFQRGDRTALTPQQVQGMQSFRDAGCATCHSGDMFSDYQLHVLSVPDNLKNTASDAGANNTYAFRTASLRNLQFTAPFMHSGVFQDLNQVVGFYGRIAGGNSQNPNVNIRQVDPLIRQVRIAGRQQEIIAFINALSDNSFDKTVPTRVPSNLNPGGNIK
ncbi:cytochrome c peroxidase [Arcicella aurantiaca]|uniref:Cytochrome c peroxidase n=2 Tax=Arcicella aurantiaca TaxID=591202 RepID=A0A316DJK9_9BACT|nr:cytochrome c peroxidase [Arcicella aurantiaca]